MSQPKTRPIPTASTSTRYLWPVATSLALLHTTVTQVHARIAPPTTDIGATEEEMLATVLANVWKAGLILGALFFVIYFVYGALEWVTGGGDKTRIEEGRHKITNSLIGLVLLAASVAIVQLIGTLFNIDFLQTLIFTI